MKHFLPLQKNIQRFLLKENFADGFLWGRFQTADSQPLSLSFFFQFFQRREKISLVTQERKKKSQWAGRTEDNQSRRRRRRKRQFVAFFFLNGVLLVASQTHGLVEAVLPTAKNVQIRHT